MGNLASLDDVEKRLRRVLTTDEKASTPGLIEEASVLVIGYLGCDPGEGGTTGADGVSDAVPVDVRVVTSRMVARTMRQGQGAIAEAGVSQIGRTMGPFSEQRTFRDGAGGGSAWLENVDKVTLKRFRCGGGMVSVPMTGDHSGRFRRLS